MNETKVYYRVLNEEEIIDEFWNSIEDLTSRQLMTQEYYPQIEAICILSLKCDIKLSSALRIATQYGHVISDIQEAVRNNDIMFPLNKFLVFDEIKNMIPLQPIVDFVVTYNQIYEETGLYLDEDSGDGQYIWEGVWEFIRRKFYINKNSRLESIFAFENKMDAENFSKLYRNNDADIAEVIIEDAKVERYDMEWMTIVPITSTMKEASAFAVNYWEGESTDKPIFELLIKGTYKLTQSNG